MTLEERDAVITLVWFGCPEDLPDELHINSDLLRRHTGKSLTRLKRLLGGVSSLGFTSSIREATEHDSSLPGMKLGDDYYFHLTWINLRGGGEYPEMLVAREMILGAAEDYCEEHGRH